MKMMKEDRGLTLVELVITIAIVSIVIAAATSFMITGSRSFTKGSVDSDLQKEAELTVNQIEDMIIDVNGGLEVNEVADAEGNKTKTELVLIHATEEPDVTGAMETKYVKETVVWDKNTGNNQMFYSKQDVTYDASKPDGEKFVDGSYIAEDQLLAENVCLFEVDKDTIDETAYDGTVHQIVRSVQIRVGYENSTGRVDYATSPVITLRNRMLLSGNLEEIFNEPPTVSANMTLWYSGPGVDGTVPIIYPDSEVQRGNLYDIFAMLDGGTEINRLVNWEIEETNCTSMIDSNGLLTVFPDEPNDWLTIIAQYKTNPNKYAKGVVKVVGGSGSDKWFQVRILTKSLEPFNPLYDSALTDFSEGNWTQEEKDSITYLWEVSEPERVEPFVNDQKTLSLNVKKDTTNYGRVFTIKLTATCQKNGKKSSDVVTYIVDSDPTNGGDSFMKRGMGIEERNHGNIWFTFDTQPEHKSDVQPVKWEYYFCDEQGRELTSPRYQELLKQVKVIIQNGEFTANHHFWYTVAFEKTLPANESYYIKVVAYMIDSDTGTEFTYERIFPIPAVELYNLGEYNVVSKNTIVFFYRLQAYYVNKWVEEPPVYQYSVEDYVYDSPYGVKSWVVLNPNEEGSWGNGTWIESDSTNDKTKGDVIRTQCTIQYDGDSSKVQRKSLTIRVSMKEYPDIYTDVKIYFDDPPVQ